MTLQHGYSLYICHLLLFLYMILYIHVHVLLQIKGLGAAPTPAYECHDSTNEMWHADDMIYAIQKAPN